MLCPSLESNQILPVFSGTLSPHKLPGHVGEAWLPRRCATIRLSEMQEPTVIGAVGPEGIEPPSAASETAVLPLNEGPS
jgi:hypothetical protein